MCTFATAPPWEFPKLFDQEYLGMSATIIALAVVVWELIIAIVGALSPDQSTWSAVRASRFRSSRLPFRPTSLALSPPFSDLNADWTDNLIHLHAMLRAAHSGTSRVCSLTNSGVGFGPGGRNALRGCTRGADPVRNRRRHVPARVKATIRAIIGSATHSLN
jgi:hypothetical protein